MPSYDTHFIGQTVLYRIDWRGVFFLLFVVLYLFVSFSLCKRGSEEILYQETKSDNQGGHK